MEREPRPVVFLGHTRHGPSDGRQPILHHRDRRTKVSKPTACRLEQWKYHQC